MTSGFSLKPKTFPLKDGETLDDILDKIATLAALPFAVETITITKTNITAQIWEPESGPPYGELPEEDPTSISSLFGRIDTVEVDLDVGSGINLDALAIVADLLIRTKSTVDEPLAGLAWVVGSQRHFCNWIGIKSKPLPVRFLEMPLIEYDDMPDERIVLLCGKSVRHHPFQSRLALATSMVIELEEEDAKV